ncbi:A-kinase anchor protein 11 isoform X2 [Hemicordylus capensis]|uniref:A-kinase anchor protein 11 isoform X2 n=1 Tax=Hemicordylus capensis TaxID=884348 RepID=UPI002302E5F2|nr:A-kinase anchor protein 11 isoform X2 [Hemicordylus capensis]
MDGPSRVRSSQRKTRISMKKSFSECALPPMKVFLQSQKELCTVSTEELKEEQDNFNEVTFLCFADETAVAPKELAAMSIELPDLLKSLHLCSLNENEILFLKDIHKPLRTTDVLKQKNHRSRILCVMRLSPSLPRFRVDSVFTLLSKYTAGIRCTVEMYLLQKHLSDISHTEEDDTNHSVSSIEDDFVTALEHLDEDESAKINSGEVTPEKHQDATSQTIPGHHLESVDPKINSLRRKSTVKSSASLVNILELKELSSSVKSSVTTSISDPWIQRSFFRPHSSSDQSLNLLHKTLFSSSPAESSESDCSSPSPVIFLDEEGYQRSLKAKLQLPKIPVMKDGIEDSDSEVSEFFDSFDQFDEQEQTLKSNSKLVQDPVLSNQSQKKMISYKSCCTTAATNPLKFKFDRPTLPANVRKPTPRKPESPYGSLLDVPDSPRPVKTSGEDSGGLFSPIRSSAFSPLGGCFSTECLCRVGINKDTINQNHNLLCHTHSDFANNISIEILGSVFSSRSSLCRYAQEASSSNRTGSKEDKGHTAKVKGKTAGKELDKKCKSKHKSLMVKDHIQKFASELVEKSFGSAFKDLQKGVTSCTNALCHLAAKLTTSVFQMAFYEIGRQQAISLKKKAINGLAGFLVSEAITGALKELHSVKQQIFTNTVAKFAADLAEELIFEGIMEVCQFSHPLTPTAFQDWSFQYNDKVVRSYAKDLSESVIQEAFIELSQVDVTFTSEAAISISMDNVKYVSAESMSASTQTSSAHSEVPDKVPVAMNPVQAFRKEYTVHKALFYTSGLASSIPVPLAGSILYQRRSSSDDIKARIHSVLDDNQKAYKDSTLLCYATKKRQDEVTSLRSIYLTADNSPSSESKVHILCKQSDFKQANNPEVSNISDLTTGIPSISNFSGTMVDMIVTEAYEAVTSSKVSKTVEQYTDILQTEKKPYLQCIGEDTCKNVFANYLAKRIVKQSVDESKSACSATSEKLAYCVGLGTNQKSNRKEFSSGIKPSETTKSVPVIVGQQQMPLNSSSKFHVTPLYSNRCLLSDCKDSEERKKHVACRTSTCTSPPCSAVSFIKHIEDLSDSESCSVKSLSNPLEKHKVYKAAGCTAFAYERVLDMNTLTSVMSNCDDAFQREDKSSIRDGNVCVVPDTPPPTPLTPSQAGSEWNLRKLTKKLKGELAKAFAPATPPSTPYRSEMDGIYESEHPYLEKEEFMLKLMRSLSEEVESSEDEERSETQAERVKAPVRTIEYADHLATHIISVATEMAASHLVDKTVQMENKHFQRSVKDKRCGYTAIRNVPEKTLNSLWVYAGDTAGKIVSEAKKMVKSRHCKFLRVKQGNHQADGFRFKRNHDEHWSKGRKHPLADQWSRETDSSVLYLPQSSEDPGLTSKYPSCESVTDEYADHIIRILKREGGHSELIMDQFASRLAYRSIKSGMQQAARKLKAKYTRKIAPAQSSKINSKFELFETVNKNTDKDIKKQKKGYICQIGKQGYENKCSKHRTECTKLLDFSESLAHSITSDVRRKLKMSAACLPKSLTDSCLYKKSKVDKVTDLTSFSKTFPPFSCKQKLYHSTGSLNEHTYRDGIIHAIEQYARKVVDDTLEVSLESATLQTTENWTNGDRSTYTEKLSPFSATACRYCSMKEHQYCTGRSSLHLPGQELYSKVHQVPNSRLEGICPKSYILPLDIPKIHIDMDEKVVFAENVVATAFDKAERQLSNTSLAADSGIGQDGISLAESLTTEIMTSCMTNMGQAANISSVGKEGFNSAESIASQQMSLSTGDDSTGSWSNLSFEDEHPDENSSFLHLSDSEGTEDNEEELKDATEGLRHTGKALLIVNVDIGPCMVDSQLRTALQWLSASEAEVAELHFYDDSPNEFVLLSNKLQERGWKVGDLFQAVLKYCEVMEKATDGERALENKTFFGWLEDHV